MHLYVSLYLTLSGVTLPLHRHLRPFTANGAFLSRAPPPPASLVGGFGGGLRRLCWLYESARCSYNANSATDLLACAKLPACGYQWNTTWMCIIIVDTNGCIGSSAVEYWRLEDGHDVHSTSTGARRDRCRRSEYFNSVHYTVITDQLQRYVCCLQYYTSS